MITKLIEATQGVEGGFNHGKFMVARFTDEWDRLSEIDRQVSGHERSLLNRCGWSREHLLVIDLQTGEGAIFRHGGLASADLQKHAVWVCPLFEPFLAWLYTQDIESLPDLVELPDAPEAMYGYRREGPPPKSGQRVA